MYSYSTCSILKYWMYNGTCIKKSHREMRGVLSMGVHQELAWGLVAKSVYSNTNIKWLLKRVH